MDSSTIIPIDPERHVSSQWHAAVVSTERELDAIAGEWIRLHDRAASSVFQSFEWIRTWWEFFGTGKTLYCLCVRDGDTLIGILPLCREEVTLLGVRLYVRLQFIGVPQSDYLDVIFEPGNEERVLAAFAEHLADTRHEWDVLDLAEIGAHSMLADALPPILRKFGMCPKVVQGPVSPQVHLPDTFEAYLNSLGRNTRYAYHKKLKQLQQRFRVQVDVVREPSLDIGRAIDTFIEIHGQRWKALGHPSVYDLEHHRGFLHTVAARFAERGWLRLFVFRVNEQPVAASIEFNYKRRIYMYQSNAVGPEEVMKHSPGLLIKFAAIERGIADGMTVYDLMRGDEPYKFDNLKAAIVHNRAILAATPAPGGRVRQMLFLLHLLLVKIISRLKLEGYEFTRFRVTKRRTVRTSIAYTVSRAAALVRLGFSYISTHLLPHKRGKEPDQSEPPF